MTIPGETKTPKKIVRRRKSSLKEIKIPLVVTVYTHFLSRVSIDIDRHDVGKRLRRM